MQNSVRKSASDGNLKKKKAKTRPWRRRAAARAHRAHVGRGVSTGLSSGGGIVVKSSPFPPARRPAPGPTLALRYRRPAPVRSPPPTQEMCVCARAPERCWRIRCYGVVACQCATRDAPELALVDPAALLLLPLPPPPGATRTTPRARTGIEYTDIASERFSIPVDFLPHLLFSGFRDFFSELPNVRRRDDGIAARLRLSDGERAPCTGCRGRQNVDALVFFAIRHRRRHRRHGYRAEH